jgi:transposase
VARRYALNANLIFKWLKDPRFASVAVVEEKSVFLPVEVREVIGYDYAHGPLVT